MGDKSLLKESQPFIIPNLLQLLVFGFTAKVFSPSYDSSKFVNLLVMLDGHMDVLV